MMEEEFSRILIKTRRSLVDGKWLIRRWYEIITEEAEAHQSKEKAN